MRTPDLTPAQLLAVAKLIVGLAVAFGLPLDAATQAELVTAVVAIAGLLIHADATIRHGRATGNLPTPPTASTDSED
jgi:hypothetical protein